jgi:hypothetical protein
VQSINAVSTGIAKPRYCVAKDNKLYISCWGPNPDWDKMLDSYIAVYNIENNTFIPPQYYVGDEVELKIKISIPESLDLTSPGEKKETEWIEITSIHIFPFQMINGAKTHDISIFFKAFKPGILTMPLLNFGDIELSNLEIHTSSVFHDNKDAAFPPFRGQLNLPDTFIKLVLILLLFILIPLFLFIIMKYIFRGLTKSSTIIMLQRPYSKLTRKIKKLKKQIKNLDSRAFYIILSEIFRHFLQVRLSIPALTSTTREISSLAKHNVLEQDLSNEIIKILSLADFIKFGGKHSSEKEKENVIQKVLFIAKIIEEEKKSVEP